MILFLVPLNWLLYGFYMHLYISYAFCSKAGKAALTEVIQATPGGRGKVYGSCFGLLELSGLFPVCGLFVFELFVAARAQAVSWGFVRYLLLHLGRNFIAGMTVGFLLGMLCSLLHKKATAYFLMVLFALLTSPLSEMLVDVLLATTGFNLFPFTDLFSVYPRMLDFSNYHTGVSILPYEWLQTGLWVFLFGGLLLFVLLQKKRVLKWLVTCGCLAVAAVCATQAASPVSRLVLNHNPIYGAMSDAWYYFEAEETREAAPFQALSYNMELTVGDNLHATVKVTLNRDDLPICVFTLFHDYKVTEVTDGLGKAVPFTQESDTLYITNSVGNRAFSICYDGFSAKYYSNRQGVFLPGSFPYYPIPGAHKLYDVEQQTFLPLCLEQPVAMRVQVHTKQRVFCNLKQVAANVYEGSSNGVTLLSGFLKEDDGTGKVIYPYLNTMEFSDRTIQNEIRPFLQTHADDPALQHVFIIPNRNLGTGEKCFVFNDHMIVAGPYGLEEIYQESRIPLYKRQLFLSIQLWKEGQSRLPDYVELLRTGTLTPSDPVWEETDLQQDFHFQMAVTIHKMGEEAFLEACEHYLADNADTRTAIAFLKALS